MRVSYIINYRTYAEGDKSPYYQQMDLRGMRIFRKQPSS